MSAKKLKEAFSAAAPQFALVEIPGIGKVMVRELTLGDLDTVDYDDTTDARAKNVALALYDEAGKERIFDPENEGDVAIIKRLGNSIINRLTTALIEKN